MHVLCAQDTHWILDEMRRSKCLGFLGSRVDNSFFSSSSSYVLALPRVFFFSSWIPSTIHLRVHWHSDPRTGYRSNRGKSWQNFLSLIRIYLLIGYLHGIFFIIDFYCSYWVRGKATRKCDATASGILLHRNGKKERNVRINSLIPFFRESI